MTRGHGKTQGKPGRSPLSDVRAGYVRGRLDGARRRKEHPREPSRRVLRSPSWAIATGRRSRTWWRAAPWRRQRPRPLRKAPTSCSCACPHRSRSRRSFRSPRAARRPGRGKNPGRQHHGRSRRHAQDRRGAGSRGPRHARRGARAQPEGGRGGHAQHLCRRQCGGAREGPADHGGLCRHDRPLRPARRRHHRQADQQLHHDRDLRGHRRGVRDRGQARRRPRQAGRGDRGGRSQRKKCSK